MPPAFFTRKRVSGRITDDGSPLVSGRLKCLIHTLPVGNDQLPPGLKPIVRLVFGTENQRDLIALSDQNGTLISNGTMPAAGCSGSVGAVSDGRFVNAPVSASVGGSVPPVLTLL